MSRDTFTFDGFGINGPGEYRERLATFTSAGHEFKNLGALLATAPQMLELLQLEAARLDREAEGRELEPGETDWRALAIETINKATGV